MTLVLYNLLLTVLSPLILLYLLRRRSIGKEDRDHWGERWGSLPESASGNVGKPRFWVHAVSVGEVMAAAPVLRELRQRWPRSFILLTTTTIGGREVALKQCPPADMVSYYPLDFWGVVGKALRIGRPDCVLLMEWEIWPNFLHRAKRRGARIAVLNGRISDRGLRRGRKGGFLTRPGLEAVDCFAMQSDEDARRAALVGADPARVRSVGNTKFDESVTPMTADERHVLRAELGIPVGAPVWICGSTRPGEEAIIADALGGILDRQPGLRLLVAPRHLDRAEAVTDAFAMRGFAVVVRSRKGSLSSAPVLLVDTFGELGRLYAVADIAFVGGSLLPFGGQSVFQPLAQGVPALFGPHMSNQRDIAGLARDAGVGFPVEDAASLAAEVIRLLDLPLDQRLTLAVAARALIDHNQGVAARCADIVGELLAEGHPT